MESTISARTQLARLLEILLALRGGHAPNARELAELCEVSRRTIYRDLETLEAAGVPLRFDPTRQGYILPPAFAPLPAAADEQEVLALALCLSASDPQAYKGIGRPSRLALMKLVQSLPSAARDRVLAQIEALGLHDVPTSEPVISPTLLLILTAIGRREQIRVVYQDQASACAVSSMVTPYRLIYNPPPTWQLIGRSTFHRGIHSFRLDRILECAATSEVAHNPPRIRSTLAPRPPRAQEG